MRTITIAISDAAEAAILAEIDIIDRNKVINGTKTVPTFDEFVTARVEHQVFAPLVDRYRETQQGERISKLLRAPADILAAIDVELAKVKDFEPVPVPADIVPGPSPVVTVEPEN